MVRTSRRRLLAGVTITALTGCVGDPSSEESTTEAPTTTEETPEPDESGESESETETTTESEGDSSLSEDVVAAIDPLPESVGDRAIKRLMVVTPGADNVPVATAFGSPEELGLAADDLDRAAVAHYNNFGISISAMVGSFDADEPSLPDRGGDHATYREDGLFLVARNQDGAWDEGIEAAKDAVDDEISWIGDGNRRALARVTGRDFAMLIPDTDRDVQIPELDIEELESIALGGIQNDDQMRIHFVGVYENEDAVDTEEFATFVAESNTEVEDGSIEQDGRLVSLTAVQDVTSGTSGAGPNLHFYTEYDPDTRTATLKFRAEESVETENLTLYVDEEPVQDPWNTDVIGGEHDVTVDTDPFTPVHVEWTDPEDDETVTVDRGIVRAPMTFETEYDSESSQATFTYTSDITIEDLEHFEISHRTGDIDSAEEPETEPLSDRLSKLETGDEVVVEGVGFGDYVSLRVSYEWENGGMSSSVATVHARPPGEFHLEEGEQPKLVYSGEQSQSAEKYRVTIAGSESSTQFADEYKTLERGAELLLDAEPGEEVVVEWTGDGGPATVLEHRIEPSVSFELRRAGEQFELTYTAETAMPADEFMVDIGRESSKAFAEEFDTLEAGDAVTVDLSSSGFVSVSWTKPEERMYVYHGSVFRLLRFEFGASDGTPTLVFDGEGEWPAGELQVRVAGEQVPGFAEQYDTITRGDSIELDAQTGTAVSVDWVRGDTSRNVFSETVHPPFDFDFEYSDGELTITSASGTSMDADAVEVAMFGGTHEEKPDLWAEEYDTIDAGDSVTVESPSDLEAVVVYHNEWDAREVFELEAQ